MAMTWLLVTRPPLLSSPYPPPPFPQSWQQWYATRSPGPVPTLTQSLLTFPSEIHRKEGVKWRGWGWGGWQKNEGWVGKMEMVVVAWGGEEVSEEQLLRAGAAIDSVSHSFCGGHFLTAFIKANLIIWAL